MNYNELEPFDAAAPSMPVFSSAAEQEAFNRLNAAAPDLLAALYTLVNWCQTPRHKSEGIARAPRQKDIDAAYAAIRKATGGVL